jgi:hypothetical protein
MKYLLVGSRSWVNDADPDPKHCLHPCFDMLVYVCIKRLPGTLCILVRIVSSGATYVPFGRLILLFSYLRRLLDEKLPIFPLGPLRKCPESDSVIHHTIQLVVNSLFSRWKPAVLCDFCSFS